VKLFSRAGANGRTMIDVIIGCGVIGEALCRSIPLIRDSTVVSAESIVTDWSARDRLKAALDGAEAWIETIETASGTLEKVRVFWCAGRAGFAASESQTSAEYDSFCSALAWCEHLLPRRRIEFHMTSSAGGLHEGQVLVRDRTRITTDRPYTRLKVAQERALAASPLPSRYIYRPSSVYGVPRAGQRLGFLPTMIKNALSHRPTVIFATASTQRDFVAASDVGSFMALEREPTERGLETPLYLVQGCPMSLWTLQLTLERHLQRRVLVTFTTSKDNFASTTFSPQLRPKGFRPATLECHLARMVAAVQGHRGAVLRRGASVPNSAWPERPARADAGPYRSPADRTPGDSSVPGR